VDESRLQLDDDQFLGVNLSLALDRRVQAANLNFRIALTPLTTFVVKNRLQHDRFTFSPERDTDSVSVAPGFEFKPTALIAGSAFVGYRRFQPRRPDQARFAGVVAAVKLGYLIRDTMRIRGTLDRDVDYSAEATQAFLLVTGGGVDLTQSLGGRWDAVLRVGRQYLDYRNLSLLDPTENRRDRTTAYGTGLGYRLRPDMRVGFDVNYLKRLSPIPTRRYSGFQFGGSFTYGS
jgi:Putative beta-barrel porin 2